MKKYIGKQILELLDNVTEGIVCVPNVPLPTATVVLDDCIAALKIVGNTLQHELPEVQYKLCQQIIQNVLAELWKSKDAQEDVDELVQHLLCAAQGLEEVKLEIKKEVSKHTEIVFMPYKSSMWDALESVWKIARKDSSCEVYVVPLPYYNRTSSGQLGDLQYDGDSFPEEVNVTYFKDYDIYEHHPDIIYVHNPYDAQNNVTSIAPEYYIEELKKHTDMLVYIPYYVVSNQILPSFCTLPGVYLSDKVIVESEAIAAQYSQYSNVEISKFLPLGSPKYDKVITTNRENCKMPTEWRERIKGKKIILYNSSLPGILAQKDELFDKLHHIFSYFQNASDIVLWWRPHPLSRITAESRDQVFYKRYCEIEDWYKKNDIGIFDDTSDMNRAIAVSDAYYGDGSSLVMLYQVTGKPIMIQNRSLSGIASHYYLEMQDCVSIGDYIYYAVTNFNCLARTHLPSGEIEYLGAFPQENLNQRLLYFGATVANNKLFFAPFAAENIAVYDLNEKTFLTIAIKHKYQSSYEPLMKYVACVSYGKYVFMQGFTCPVILRIDTETMKVTYYDDWYKNNKHLFGESIYGELFCYTSEVVENTIYIPLNQSNILFAFNMDTCKGRFIRVGSDQNNYGAVICNGKQFLLPSLISGTIVLWDGVDNGAVQELKMPRVLGDHKGVFSSAVVGKEHVNFYYAFIPYVIRVHLKSLQVDTVELDGFERGCHFAKRIGDKIIALGFGKDKNVLYRFNLKHEEAYAMDSNMLKEHYELSDSALQNDIRLQMQLAILCENTYYVMEDFIEFVRQLDESSGNGFYPTNKNNDGHSGERIHIQVMRLLKEKHS